MVEAFVKFEVLLREMVEASASDLFLRAGDYPRQRINGALCLVHGDLLEPSFLDSVLRQVLRPVQWEFFQKDGEIDFGLSLRTGERFRVNAHLQRGVLGIVVRSIRTGNLEIEALGLPAEVRNFANLSRGLVVLAGATGSGKSTTLAAMVHHINTNASKHIVTIEDPIEYVHETVRSLVTQREVGSDTQDFKTALKNVVRESPDVIVIGELRDAESAHVALSAAMTGHLVIVSLHTMDVIQAVQRILSFFPEHLQQQVRFDLALCLEGILAQRLIPMADGSGRAPAVEVLTVTPAVRRLLRDNKIEDVVDLMENSPGMCSFNKAICQLFDRGLIGFDAGAAYATNPDAFRMHAVGMLAGTTAFPKEIDLAPVGDGLEMSALLHSAFRHGASDIHLTAGSPPVFRVNGELRPLEAENLSSTEIRRLLFNMLNHSQRERFELEKELDFAVSIASGIRFRVNAHFQRNTVAVAMRMIVGTLPAIEKLRLPNIISKLAHATQGLLLVTGPTGSGKSTTLAALVDLINTVRSCRIITIEDPIEFVHQNRMSIIEQREIGPDTKSFAAALKYVLRQDPDVILVGEMRDLETIQAVITAAETGHLVLATLHTNDAPQTVDRIIDVFPADQQEQVRSQFASALLGVVSQRLLRKSDGLGRIGAFEVLVSNNAVRTIVREGKTHQLLGTMETAVKEGMQTLDRSIQELLRGGLISREEALKYVRSPASLEAPFPVVP